MDSRLYPIRFSYPPCAPGPVALAGSFNHWDPRAHFLSRVDGEWRIIVSLHPGTYPYAIVSGGRLVRDPDPRRSPLGARYSVVTVDERDTSVCAPKQPPLLIVDRTPIATATELQAPSECTRDRRSFC